MSSLVRYDVSDRVATITLDSPKNRNALSRTLVTELTGHLDAAQADPEPRAVVLTHTGHVFCSGADLSEAGAQPSSDATTAMMTVMTKIVELDKPVIARLAGHVRAGGMGIVGACDAAFATEAASFAFTEARIGLAPAIISLTTLDLMPPRAASRYYLTGETFGAQAAAEAGLITGATTEAELDGLVAELVSQIKETSPQGSAETKRLLTRARRQRMAADSADMAALSARLFASGEAQEGIHAFLERRPPAWRQ
ncbi:MAG TPA: enoyl-CoA hydratase family protein [Streptosporangiaceae bacterium]|jgi:enoyl-CoA hydratase